MIVLYIKRMERIYKKATGILLSAGTYSLGSGVSLIADSTGYSAGWAGELEPGEKPIPCLRVANTAMPVRQRITYALSHILRIDIDRGFAKHRHSGSVVGNSFFCSYIF